MIAPMIMGRQRPLTAVVRYGAGRSPKSPSVTYYHDTATQLKSPLVPDGGGRCLTQAAIVPTDITGRRPSSNAAVFYEDSYNRKSPSEPYWSYHI